MILTTEQKPTTTSAPHITISNTTNEMSKEFATLITNAFGLMAVFAWTEFVKKLFKKGGPLSKNPLGGPFAFACLVTCIAVVVTLTLGRLKKPECTNLCPSAG